MEEISTFVQYLGLCAFRKKSPHVQRIPQDSGKGPAHGRNIFLALRTLQLIKPALYFQQGKTNLPSNESLQS